jgi:hypothetical protein
MAVSKLTCFVADHVAVFIEGKAVASSTRGERDFRVKGSEFSNSPECVQSLAGLGVDTCRKILPFSVRASVKIIFSFDLARHPLSLEYESTPIILTFFSHTRRSPLSLAATVIRPKAKLLMWQASKKASFVGFGCTDSKTELEVLVCTPHVEPVFGHNRCRLRRTAEEGKVHDAETYVQEHSDKKKEKALGQKYKQAMNTVFSK